MLASGRLKDDLQILEKAVRFARFKCSSFFGLFVTDGEVH